MIIKNANAEWNGGLKDGKGSISVESGLFKDAGYSFAKRFGNESGTNPEELIGAAHSACFSMALSAGLDSKGHKPASIKTTAKVHLEKVGEGFGITRIELNCEGKVPGIDNTTFVNFAEDAKKNCPVSKALAGVKIELSARLLS
jgi:osmotically inducible protein OsmC